MNNGVRSLISSIMTMLCLGSLYAWSIFVPELKSSYGLSNTQTQIIFGTMIALLTVTMIFADKIQKIIKSKTILKLSALFFCTGYIFAGSSGGNFFLILLGIGFLAGIGSGLGYFISLTVPIKFFPKHKGLIVGISTAALGLGTVFLIYIVKPLISVSSVTSFFTIIGLTYGTLIFLASVLMKEPVSEKIVINKQTEYSFFETKFFSLFIGIFCGCFSGLLVIGNLKSIGYFHGIDVETLFLGVAILSVANFIGRLVWGWISDHARGIVLIPIALLFQSIFVLLIGTIELTSFSYITLAGAVGFGFGANFVLFARETAQLYGVNNLGHIYPYVFLGYGAAGIFGPIAGGLLFDYLKTPSYLAYTGALMSLLGFIVFLFSARKFYTSETQSDK